MKTSYPSVPSKPFKGKRIPTLSLFSGAGGLDLGFHSAGFDVVTAVEIEEAYCDSLRANRGPEGWYGPNLEVYCGDVRHFVETLDVDRYRKLGIQCVIGGPPCQTFSAAGRRSGGVLGTDDERGQLFRAYCDILQKLEPKVFVFENVYGLPGANGGGPWREIVAAFSDIGYTLRAEVMDAADFGVPQHRERLIMVGFKSGDFGFPLPTHGPDSPSSRRLVSVMDAIGDLQDASEPEHNTLGGRYGHLLPLVPPGLNYSFFTSEMGYPEPVFAWRSKFHDLLYKADPSAPTRTIKARPGKFTGPFHWKNRHFTADEMRRLQSFPEGYQLVGRYNKVVEQIGNSVPPILAYVTAISVREQLLDSTNKLTYPIRPDDFKSTFRQRQRARNKHFHEVARREIAERFSVPVETDTAALQHDEYFLRTNGFFGRERSVIPSAEVEPTHREYRTTLDWAGEHIELSIANIVTPEDVGLKYSIEISGLKKYLRRIDTIRVDSLIEDMDDVFHVWATIEEVLIKRSEFFTLIDIYGHYANRGDTVKVKSNFAGDPGGTLGEALQFFGQSENCGEIERIGAVAERLQVEIDELLAVVNAMRSIRWDIRTSATHPTIADDAVICTYPFPLLSEKAHLERRVQSLAPGASSPKVR